MAGIFRPSAVAAHGASHTRQFAFIRHLVKTWCLSLFRLKCFAERVHHMVSQNASLFYRLVCTHARPLSIACMLCTQAHQTTRQPTRSYYSCTAAICKTGSICTINRIEEVIRISKTAKHYFTLIHAFNIVTLTYETNCHVPVNEYRLQISSYEF